MADEKMILEVVGRKVSVSNPHKIFFPATGHTKLDLIRYYLSVAEGALRGVAGRPMVLKRFVHGADGEAFFQKRAPANRPAWIETVELRFPSGRTAEEVVAHDAAALAWAGNLGCIDLNPHPVLASDLDHPDELRVDLDPVPGVGWQQILDVALVAKEALESFGLAGWPKTSGSRGFHVYARIEPRWSFSDVRRAAVALAREIERRAPDQATSKWWKEERRGVFVDYNQNAKDRTVASAYSVRPVPDARVSTPLSWAEVPGCDPAAFTIDTVPARFAQSGDPWAGMDDAAGSLELLLERAAGDEAAGLPDAPWPPHFVRQAGEEPRVQPSKRRRGGAAPAPDVSAAPAPGVSAAQAPGVSAAQAPGVSAAQAPGVSAAQAPGVSAARAPAVSAAGAPGVPPPAPGKSAGPTGRRRSSMPLIEVARAATKPAAMEGLERWKARHASVWPQLAPEDVLVDTMRGRSSTWTRIRINLQHVPETERPAQAELEVDYDPWAPGSR
jgi:bifunctional non-homologous end joining protein LigD